MAKCSRSSRASVLTIIFLHYCKKMTSLIQIVVVLVFFLESVNVCVLKQRQQSASTQSWKFSKLTELQQVVIIIIHQLRWAALKCNKIKNNKDPKTAKARTLVFVTRSHCHWLLKAKRNHTLNGVCQMRIFEIVYVGIQFKPDSCGRITFRKTPFKFIASFLPRENDKPETALMKIMQPITFHPSLTGTSHHPNAFIIQKMNELLHHFRHKVNICSASGL